MLYNTILKLFIGTDQSRYAALAIVVAVIAVSFAILFGRDPLPFGQKLGFLLLVILISFPGFLLSLFQLTCIVTGGKDSPVCGLYGWLITGLLIIYSGLLVVIAITSVASGSFVITNMIINNKNENFEQEYDKVPINNSILIGTQELAPANKDSKSPGSNTLPYQPTAVQSGMPQPLSVDDHYLSTTKISGEICPPGGECFSGNASIYGNSSISAPLQTQNEINLAPIEPPLLISTPSANVPDAFAQYNNFGNV